MSEPPPIPDLWLKLISRARPDESAQAPGPDRLALLDRYLELLMAANERMNLTRITDRAAAEVQHVGDALTLLPLLPAGAIRLADVGSGGGVPGLPLAIVRPEISVTLIESTRKKAAFLRDAVEALALTNVTVVDTRAEDAAQRGAPLRESFDIAVARAVATMNWLAEWLLPLVRKGGLALAMKGPKVHEELPPAARAIRALGGGEPIIHPVDLPGTEHRVIVAIPKLARTDPRYPRRSTAAQAKPL